VKVQGECTALPKCVQHSDGVFLENEKHSKEIAAQEKLEVWEPRNQQAASKHNGTHGANLQSFDFVARK
jgi:hypothetical protein